MPLTAWNIEWSNANSQRRYPLTDDSSAEDTTGAFHLPNDFLIGLDLPIHAGLDVNPARFFVKHVGAYSTGYLIVVGYQPASGDPVDVATALISRQGHTRNKAYTLGGVGLYADTVGKVVIGRLDAIDNEPAGFWGFDLDNARLEPDAVRPILRGVSAITVVNGTQRSQPIYGDIELQAGTNVQLVPILIGGQDPIIRINAVEGEGTIEECVCAGDAVPAEPIRTINGIAPTGAGNLAFVGGTCIQIQPIANGLRFLDTCSAPCCGCTELEKITEDLQRLNEEIATVEVVANRLQVAVDTFDAIVLGSRLSDRGCNQSCE